MKTSLIGLPFLIGLTALALVSLGMAARRRFGRAGRWVAGGLGVVLAFGSGAGWVNSYFSYYPSAGALLGRRAMDQATAGDVRLRVRAASLGTPVRAGGGERGL